MSNQKKHLVLIDGYGFVFRAYYSLPALVNSEGTVVGALYGYSNMLLKTCLGLNADYIATVFDYGKNTFRNEIYADYKANREAAPDDLIPQFPLVREVTQKMGILTLEKEGYEADDIIATFTKLAEQQKIKVTIISSDKDLLQLVMLPEKAKYPIEMI